MTRGEIGIKFLKDLHRTHLSMHSFSSRSTSRALVMVCWALQFWTPLAYQNVNAHLFAACAIAILPLAICVLNDVVLLRQCFTINSSLFCISTLFFLQHLLCQLHFRIVDLNKRLNLCSCAWLQVCSHLCIPFAERSFPFYRLRVEVLAECQLQLVGFLQILEISFGQNLFLLRRFLVGSLLFFLWAVWSLGSRWV